MKNLECKLRCGYKTASEQMLWKHHNQKHQIKKDLGRPKKVGGAKDRKVINLEYYEKAKARRLHQKTVLSRFIVSFRQRVLRANLAKFFAGTRLTTDNDKLNMSKLEG